MKAAYYRAQRKKFMKSFSRGIIAILGTLSIMALGSGTSAADPDSPVTRPVPCPNPVVVSMTRGRTMAASPNVADFPSGLLTGMAYGGTSINKTFRDPFVFKKPDSKCCQFQAGKLTVTYKALQGGPANSSTSANDAGGLVYHGASVAGSSGPIYGGAVTTGFTKTVTDVVPANIVARGRVSFSEEDDTDVVSATLEVSGCCLDPTPVR